MGAKTIVDYTSFKKKVFGNTGSRILFVFIDLFMVTLKIQGADKDVPFEIHLVRICNESLYVTLQNNEARTALVKLNT